ncbi:YHYH protein [Algoriphagus aquimarinus]|uniref:YHYH protein n=1 Tax=Algoriphagus aquimarinus TaxID=237018 RepID=UPI0030D9A26F|tara:strand:- start:6119 stop:7423 length:1305 start_codon:yes stop_codon:yes gene_type:complete
MKRIFTLLVAFILASAAYAHEGGHGAPTKVWHFSNGTATLKADLIKKEGEKVFLRNVNHQVLSFDYSDFQTEEQAYITEQVNFIDRVNASGKSNSGQMSNYLNLLLIVGISMFIYALFRLKESSAKPVLAYSLLAVSFVLMGCANQKSFQTIKMAANDIPFLESVFGAFDKVHTRYDEQYFYIESDGLPNHEMMTGITNWQQQVPINHEYSGSNAWAIPLQPELAEHPLSTKDNFMKGAIAIAANGIPIFNPLNNRGEDANVIGELDKWGGHCGRADDYHYHLPPAHLQAQVGADKPIAYALDGFPVYGETSEELDENLGRFTTDSTYQYHAVKEYPYLIAAMKGKVEINPRTQAPENEIMPQAKTRGVRPDLRPLRGAEITDFKNPAPQQFSLTYTLNSKTHIINYGWDDAGNYSYEFINPEGSREIASYQRR